MNESLESRIRRLIRENRLWHLGPLLSDPSTETLEAFQRVWETLDPPTRQELATYLVEDAEAEVLYDFRPIFRRLLGDEDPRVRALAIEGLWEDESPALISPLLYILQHDPDPEVRAAAATSLGRFVLLSELGTLPAREIAPVVEALIDKVNDEEEDLDVRRRALESIAYIGEPHIYDLIERAYYHPDVRMQASALFSMGRSADERWGPLVLAELESPEPELRYEAALAAGELELLEALPVLTWLAEHEDDIQVREAAIEALGRIGGPEAERVLTRLLESRDESVDEAVRLALEELRFKDDELPPLIDLWDTVEPDWPLDEDEGEETGWE